FYSLILLNAREVGKSTHPPSHLKVKKPPSAADIDKNSSKESAKLSVGSEDIT
uniref:Uncharacterized protein n=1 Tax=Rattus norvegicus TaxID=10116 RepID=A0A0G2JWK3_RAT